MNEYLEDIKEDNERPDVIKKDFDDLRSNVKEENKLEFALETESKKTEMINKTNKIVFNENSFFKNKRYFNIKKV